MPEKILTSFQSVHEQNFDEQDALNRFKNAIFRAGEIEKNAEGMSSQGISHGFLYLHPKFISIIKIPTSTCINFIVTFFIMSDNALFL